MAREVGMKTVEDLRKLREKARRSLALRTGETRARITIAMGTCGIAAGAREVLMAVLDELEQRELTDIAVTQSGCRGLCEREPMMEVQTADGAPITYGDLNPEKARAVVAHHIGDGVVVEEWVVSQAARPEPTAEEEA